MLSISLIKHAPRAPGLRLLGCGPNFRPVKGINKLQELFQQNTFWAKERNKAQIRKMLANSNVIITLWDPSNNLIGFGRATTDQVYRAVLWDIIVSEKLQGLGYGKIIIEALLNDKRIKSVEKVYLMTTNGLDFYKQFGFEINSNQSLMILNRFIKII